MGFKFLGKIGEKEVVVMIGTAATHNFISKKLVAELRIPTEKTRSYSVSYVAGDGYKGSEVCINVVIKTHGVEIIQRFFPTDVAIADVVLGSEWLRCLGAFVMNAGPTMTITANWLGRRVTFHSDPSFTKGMEIGVMTLRWDDEQCNKKDGDE